MHVLNCLNSGVAVLPVIVHSEIVGWIAGDFLHEICDPRMTGIVASTRRTNELVALVSKGQDLVVPGVCGLLGRDPSTLGLVIEMDDAIMRPLDSCPVVTIELRGVVDHRMKWCAAFKLRGCPSVPVADGVHWAVEIDFVHLARTIVGVGIVPEQASFRGHSVQSGICDLLAVKRRCLGYSVPFVGRMSGQLNVVKAV